MGSIAARLGKALSVGGEMMFQIGMEEKRADLTAKRDANLAAIQAERDKVNIDAQNARLDRDLESREAIDKRQNNRWQQTFNQQDKINTSVQARLDQEASNRNRLAELEIGAAERTEAIEIEARKIAKDWWAADPSTEEGKAQRIEAARRAGELSGLIPVDEQNDRMKEFAFVRSLPGMTDEKAMTAVGWKQDGSSDAPADVQIARIMVDATLFPDEGRALAWLREQQSAEQRSIINAAHNLAVAQYKENNKKGDPLPSALFKTNLKLFTTDLPRAPGPDYTGKYAKKP